jgi:hypothetical protein
MARFAAVLSLALLLTSFASAQSNPLAIQYAQQAIAALTGGTSVTDVTVTGTVTWTSGSDNETGTVTLYGKGQYESRIDLVLTGGNRSEIVNGTNAPQAEWTDSSGNTHLYAAQNCVTDAVWFFPVFSSLAFGGNSNQVLTYVGLETLNGVSVQHLNSVWYGLALTSMDFYLDATTFLPVQINFNAHPDSDAGTNIPVQVLFSNYQTVNGLQLPYTIQKTFNGTVLLSAQLTNVSVNSGLSDSLFTIQ